MSARRLLTALLVTAVAALIGATSALAKPAPLIEPGTTGGTGSAGTGSTGTGSESGFLDGWLQMSLAAVAVVVALAAIAMLAGRARQHRHHVASAA